MVNGSDLMHAEKALELTNFSEFGICCADLTEA
jgi:hypothetical protein